MGKPSSRNGGLFRLEYIEPESDIRGSETSQYPEEKKEKSISRVVASEMETA